MSGEGTGEVIENSWTLIFLCSQTPVFLVLGAFEHTEGTYILGSPGVTPSGMDQSCNASWMVLLLFFSHNCIPNKNNTTLTLLMMSQSHMSDYIRYLPEDIWIMENGSHSRFDAFLWITTVSSSTLDLKTYYWDKEIWEIRHQWPTHTEEIFLKQLKLYTSISLLKEA